MKPTYSERAQAAWDRRTPEQRAAIVAKRTRTMRTTKLITSIHNAAVLLREFGFKIEAPKGPVLSQTIKDYIERTENENSENS